MLSPQAQSVPSLFRARLKAAPQAMAAQSWGSAYAGGGEPVLGVAEAEVALEVAAPGPEAAISLQGEAAAVATGDGCPVVGHTDARGSVPRSVSPKPRSPSLLSPQAQRLPSLQG